MCRIFFYLLLLLLPALVIGQQDSSFNAKDPRQLKDWLSLSWDLRFHQPDSAKYFGLKALDAARKLNHSHYEAEALHNISIIFEAKGDYINALAYANQALTLYTSLEEELGIANTSNNIGIIYEELGDFTSALNFYNEAYTHYKSVGDTEKQALVSVNLGILFKAQGEYLKVIDYYHDAYAVYRNLNMLAESAFCEANLGSVYYYTKQYDSCLFYSLKAEKAFIEHRNLQFLPVAQMNAGMAYFEIGKRTEARKYLQLALDGQRSYDNPKEIAFALIQLAKVNAGDKNYQEAIRQLEEAKSIAEGIGASPQVMDAAKLLSEYYAAISSYQKAWQESSHYSMVKDSLFEQEKMKTIADFQTKYETDRKEQQITLLRQETDIQKLKIRQRNYLLISLFLLIGIGVLFVYFLLSRRKMKAEAQLEQQRHLQQEEATRAVMIAEERERRRIAADLHDGVGQTLSAALMHIDRIHELYADNTTAKLSSGKVVSLLTESYDDIRSLSHRMMPRTLLKQGLPQALKELLDKIDGGRITVALEMFGLEQRLPEQVETILYRIIQEALHNVIKHANASSLSVQLTKDDEDLLLNIEDNGKGFDIHTLDHSEGIGIKNLYSRISLLGGTAEIDSMPGKGTLISVCIPVANIKRLN